MTNSILRYCACFIFIFAAFGSLSAQTTNTQTPSDPQEALVKGLLLFKMQRFAEAVPYLETAVNAKPDDAQLRFLYGFSLVGKSKQINDTAEAKKASEKALEQFREAKRLGLNDPDNEAMIRLLSGKPSAGEEPMYSGNKQAEEFMQQAESYFTQSNYDEAIKFYEKALALDPKIYRAATGGGDAYVAKSDWESAEKWYQRAIAIDPNRETTYRYSATPLMKQKKYDQARDRYVEAFITEPYSQLAPRGISQWAEVTGAKLGHPVVDVPELSFDTNGKASPKETIAANDPSMSPWLAYIATRENWKKVKFAKTFREENSYRHSLAEESEAIRNAVKAAKEQKSPNKQFDLLAKLDADGVLEAYILLAQPDEGIAQDHAEYLKNNRPKLRQYVLNYVIQK